MEIIRSEHIDLGRLVYFVVNNTEYDRWRSSASYSAPLPKTVCIYSSEQSLSCAWSYTPTPLSLHACLTFTLFLPPLKQFPLPVMHTLTHKHTFVSIKQSGLFCLQPAIHFAISYIKEVRCGSKGLTAQQSHTLQDCYLS